MSEFEVKRATRAGVHLLIGISGGTGSGKSWSAMEMASGLSGGEPFGVVDTENGRASHYADHFTFDVVNLAAPFTPARYQAAIQALIDAGHEVIVVDSMSHEWEGQGGLLELHDEIMGGDQRKNMQAWIKPKTDHRKLVTYLLQVHAHVILAFRAAERVETVKVNGRMEVQPKQSLTGLNGWLPISEKSLPYELTASFLLTADAPGVPKPIKLQEQHRPFVPLDRPLSRSVGVALAEWAAGGSGQDALEAEIQEKVTRLLGISDELGNRDAVEEAVTANRGLDTDMARHSAWLSRQIDAQESRLAAKAQEEDIALGTGDAETAADLAQSILDEGLLNGGAGFDA